MGIFRRQKQLLGLDIGSHAIKAVELSASMGRAMVTGWGYVPLTGETSEESALRSLVESGTFTCNDVATAVTGRSVIVRFILFQKMPEAELSNAIQYESDKYIPFEMDEVIMDYEVVGETADGKEMKVLLAAVKRSVVEDQVMLLQGVGLEPAMIGHDSFALSNALDLSSRVRHKVSESAKETQQGEDKIPALVNVGASKTIVSVLIGGKPVFSREIYVAGNDLTRGISNRLNIPQEEAEGLKISAGERAEEVQDATAPLADDLANEIALCFDYCENQHECSIGEVLVSGGGSLMHGLKETFERSLNRPTRRWDPTREIPVAQEMMDVEGFKERLPHLAVAFGLASRVQDM